MSTENWTTVPLTLDYIHGAFELSHTSDGVVPHRRPAWAVRQAHDPQISMMETQPSGARIAFRSVATEIEVTLLRTRTTYTGVPARPDGVIGLVIDGETVSHLTTNGGETTTINFDTGQPMVEYGPEFTAHFTGLAGRIKTVRDLVAAQRDHRDPPGGSQRPGPRSAYTPPQSLAPSRQLDQSRLERNPSD